VHILVTGGGCVEPIDGVRSITNFSTGTTATYICDALADRNHTVCAVMASHAVCPTKASRLLSFTDYASLAALLEQELSTNHYDLVIHLAAVSDYRISSIEIDGQLRNPAELQKISEPECFSIHVQKNPKILDHLKKWSCGGETKVIAFKLTNKEGFEGVQKAISAIAEKKCTDFIVHNDLAHIDKNEHRFTVYQHTTAIYSGKRLEDLVFFLQKEVL